MKEGYLEELKELLSEYSIKQDELEDILADYHEMIEDAKSKKMSDDEIIKMIGSPKQVVKDLSEELESGEEYIYYHRGGPKPERRDNRLTALMPFISVIIYFILGFGFNLWHPGWLVFLSIPMVAIVVNAFDKNAMNGLVALSPFIAVITYLILGFSMGAWHPGWLVFMIIPLMGILSGIKTMKFLSFLTAISPFIITITFIFIGTYTGVWNPYWLLFLLIPMIGILHEPKAWKVIVMELSFAIAIAGYLVSGYIFEEWVLGLFSFLIPIGVSILVSDDSFLVINVGNKTIWIMTLILGVIYIGLGILIPETWAYLWMIFLIIPVYAIVRYSSKSERIIAVMPFVSLIIFFSLGFFFTWWKFAWIAFLLIPMVAILKDNKK
ncbi:MAG: DUF1700 domain-containing protein [Tenericutes bacterium]|nr:DUF1700 domain-containing protein [Mycoplasmatota bacterium]